MKDVLALLQMSLSVLERAVTELPDGQAKRDANWVIAKRNEIINNQKVVS